MTVPVSARIFCVSTLLLSLLTPMSSSAQEGDVPKSIAESVGGALHWTERQFLGVAEAMPESKYDFVPSAGEFKGVRSFAEQVKHVACSNFAFFNEIEGKTPPEHCEKGGSAAAETKAELVKYLRDSFDYGDRVLATINAQNALVMRKTLWRVSTVRTLGRIRAWELPSRRCGILPIITGKSRNI